jgi:hypothetical protein
VVDATGSLKPRFSEALIINRQESLEMRIAILLMLLAAASTVAAGQANAGAFAPCRGADLSVRHVSDDAAMGGHDLIDYALRNNSSSPCTLKGYPRYELLDRSGKVRRRGRAINSPQLPGDETKVPPQLVTLEPGKEASFRVYYNSGGAGHMGKPCPVSRKIRITAPGTTRHFSRREEVRLCFGLAVSAVRKALPE